MVLGRRAELTYLNTCYKRAGSRILVFYGQKGVGKRALLQEFVQDKPCYYYHALSCSEREQLYQWGKKLKGEGIAVPEYPSYSIIFQKIAGHKKTKKVLVIDDFPCLVKSGQSFMKELAVLAGRQKKEGQLMVILCASSIGWVENSMVGKMGELARTLSGFLKVRELPFQELMEYFKGFRLEECVEAYAVLGGIPKMWQYFDDRLTIQENLCDNILSAHCYLQEQGERILAGELRESGVYNTILAALAEGRHKLNDLYQHTGFSRAKISVYLKNLMELELVEKVFSYDSAGRENTQKGIYRISNHFMNFYFTYLFPNRSAWKTQKPMEFYREYIAPTFKCYVADYFKAVCVQKLEQWNQRKQLPFLFVKKGEWVGKAGTIDLVAQDEKENTLIGLCNWDRPLMTYDDYERLLFCAEKARLRPDYIYLFSAGHFDEKLKWESKVKKNIKLISVDEF